MLIEATIVEVQLNNNYQQGIDLRRSAHAGSPAASSAAACTGHGDAAGPGAGILTATRTCNPFAAQSPRASFLASLEAARDVRQRARAVAARRSASINNQTALLKVVENVVYFTITSQISQATANVGSAHSRSPTVPQTVPVGFVMNVTPQISETDAVLLNVKPTHLADQRRSCNDPNPVSRPSPTRSRRS